jgi:hypothetical protein
MDGGSWRIVFFDKRCYDDRHRNVDITAEYYRIEDEEKSASEPSADGSKSLLEEKKIMLQLPECKAPALPGTLNGVCGIIHADSLTVGRVVSHRQVHVGGSDEGVVRWRAGTDGLLANISLFVWIFLPFLQPSLYR